MSKKYDRKHLTLSQRVMIEKGLDNNESFTVIAAKIGKDPGTVSKEVRRHLSPYTKHENGRAVPCTLRSNCQKRSLCGGPSFPIICKICRKSGLRCTDICPDYVPKTCEKLEKLPYVYNACKKCSNCLMERAF